VLRIAERRKPPRSAYLVQVAGFVVNQALIDLATLFLPFLAVIPGTFDRQT
jgi:hypothetical protein